MHEWTVAYRKPLVALPCHDIWHMMLHTLAGFIPREGHFFMASCTLSCIIAGSKLAAVLAYFVPVSAMKLYT